MQPFVHTYVLHAVGLYNALLTAGPLYRAYLAQQIRDAQVCGVRNWFWHFSVVMVWLLPRDHWARRFNTLDANDPIPYGRTKKAMRERYVRFMSVMANVPVNSGEGVRRGVYFRQVAGHKPGTLPQYMKVNLSPGIVRDCMLFRLGAHALQVQPWKQPTAAYRRRYCVRCQPNRVDTEEHCLLACGCQKLVAARNALFAALPAGRVPARVGDMFDCPGRSMGQLRQVVRYVAYCQRHTRSLASPAEQAAAQAAAEAAAAAEGEALGEDADPEGDAGQGTEEGSELAEVTASEEGSELVEVAAADQDAPAPPLALADFRARPEDQGDLWEGLFDSEDEDSLGVVGA
jgi:hypothetical protein